MKVYKLTDAQGRTRNDTQWDVDVEHHIDGALRLCLRGLHCYASPELAVMMDPIHGDYLRTAGAQLWECEASDERIADRLKSCHRWVRTIRRVAIPAITATQRLAFAILCALEVCTDSRFQSWAEDWLSGKNRPTSHHIIYLDKMELHAFSDDIRDKIIRYIQHSIYHRVYSGCAGLSANLVAETAIYVAEVPGRSIDFVTLAKKAMEY